MSATLLAQAGEAKVELPVGCRRESIVELPPPPPSKDVLDIRAIVDGLALGGIPEEATECDVTVQGIGVKVGILGDGWAVEVNGEIKDGAVAVSVSDRVRVRRA